ncbi:hypothetical protein AAMO2058_000814800 [Amorphochlora amoebiformis]|eukprot:545776-Amorphochlora_amoeboformis.AAC.1
MTTLPLVLAVLSLPLSVYGDGDEPFEWSASFDLTVSNGYSWRAEKTGCPLSSQSYAEATMKIAVIAIANTSLAGLKAAEETAEDAFKSATDLQVNGGSIMTGMGYNLVFKNDQSMSSYPISVTVAGSYGIYAEHIPTEFEFENHYLVDESDNDVEPVAVEGGPVGHSHGHVGECILGTARPDCECTNAGKMDCRQREKMIEQMKVLMDNDCNKSCNCYKEVCRDAFFFIDMHHSGCDEDDLPKDIEENYHDYEGACQRCYQPPHQNMALPQCDFSPCNKEYALGNTTLLNTPACQADRCQNETCQSAWRHVIAHHDSCCSDTTPELLEEKFHDFEETCLLGCRLRFNETYVANCNAPKNQGLRSDSNKDDDGLSEGGLIAIVVVVVVVALVILGALIFYCYLKPKTIEEARKTPMKLATQTSAQDELKAAV